jgi:hypothetical protein
MLRIRMAMDILLLYNMVCYILYGMPAILCCNFASLIIVLGVSPSLDIFFCFFFRLF